MKWKGKSDCLPGYTTKFSGSVKILDETTYESDPGLLLLASIFMYMVLGGPSSKVCCIRFAIMFKPSAVDPVCVAVAVDDR